MKVSSVVTGIEFETFSYMVKYEGFFDGVTRSRNRLGLYLTSPHIDTNQRIFVPLDDINVSLHTVEVLPAAQKIAEVNDVGPLPISLYAQGQTRKVTILSHYDIEIVDRSAEGEEFDMIIVKSGDYTYTFPQVVRESAHKITLNLDCDPESLQERFTKNRGQAVLSWINKIHENEFYVSRGVIPPILFIDRVEHRPRAVLLTPDGAALDHQFVGCLFQRFDKQGLIQDLECRGISPVPKTDGELLALYLSDNSDYIVEQQIKVIDMPITQFAALFEEDETFFIDDEGDDTEESSEETFIYEDSSPIADIVSAVNDYCRVVGVPLPEENDALRLRIAAELVRGITASNSNALAALAPVVND